MEKENLHSRHHCNKPCPIDSLGVANTSLVTIVPCLETSTRKQAGNSNVVLENLENNQHQHEPSLTRYQHNGQGHPIVTQQYYHKQDQRSCIGQRHHQHQQRHIYGPPSHSILRTNFASPSIGNHSPMSYCSSSIPHESCTRNNISKIQQRSQPSQSTSNSEQYQQYGGTNRRMHSMSKVIQGRPHVCNKKREQLSSSSHLMHKMHHMPTDVMAHTLGMTTQDTGNNNQDNITQANYYHKRKSARACSVTKKMRLFLSDPEEVREGRKRKTQESCSQATHNNVDPIETEAFNMERSKVFRSPTKNIRQSNVKGSEIPNSFYDYDYRVKTPLYNINSFEIGDITPLTTGMHDMDSFSYIGTPFASPLKSMSFPRDFFESNINVTRSMSIDDKIDRVSASASESSHFQYHQRIPNLNKTPFLNSSRGRGKKDNLSHISSSTDKFLFKRLQSSPLLPTNCSKARNTNERNIPMQSTSQILHPKQHFDEQFSKLFPFDPDTLNRSIKIPPLSSKRDNDKTRGDIFMHSRSTCNRMQDCADEDASNPFLGSFRLKIGNIGGMKEPLEEINGVLRSHPRQTLPSDDCQKMQTPIKKFDCKSIAKPLYPKSSLFVTGTHFPSIPTPSPNTTKASIVHSMNERQSSRLHRRNPCNCKKSKCLKLYCECFAAELYCQGCNCNNCNNTLEHQSVRSKAINDTKAKNPNAFKPRIIVKDSSPSTPGRCASPSKGHNMGCRCKKSACLKKYCECFEAGVICSSKCKCIECLNYVGSQALINRLRKIKDHRGAEIAMRTADQLWKGNRTDPDTKSAIRNLRMPPQQGVFPSPISQHNMMSHPMGMLPIISPASHHIGSQIIVRSMGYSPMGASQLSTPASPSDDIYHLRRNDIQGQGVHLQQHAMQPRTLLSNTPSLPTVKCGFDSHSGKKKMKVKKEFIRSYFGRMNPGQTKNTAIVIFSYLDNYDIYNTSLVSHSWSKLSLGEELWQF